MTVPDRIEREVLLHHPVRRVWDALTTAEGLAGWFGSTAQIDLRPGGTGTLGWDEPKMTAPVTVAVVEPPHRFAFRWGINGLPDGDPRTTLVEFTLTPVPEGTRLRVVESGFAQAAEVAEAAHKDNTEGWAHELADLVRYLDGAAA